ncbi:MAG: type VI secretion system protein TssA [Pseudomonadota bacterium]
MRLDDYSTERADGGPSGENLEYDPDFTALMLAAQPREERQAGKEIIPGEDPDFKEVSEKALSVLARSHDLRVGMVLAQAQLALGGYDGLAGPLAYVRSCLEQFWDSCHPLLDADDDNDPTMRINAVAGLAGADMLRRLRLAPLTDSPTFGRLGLRDVAIADGETPAPAGMANVPDKAKLAAAFMDTRPEVLKARMASVRALVADTAAIGAVFDAQTPGDGPNLDPLLRLLRRAAKVLAEAIGEPEVEMQAQDADPAQPTAAVAAPVTVPGAITSAADVRQTLDRIIDYYGKFEPSSPLPLLLHRARRLVGADFMTIMKDIAPAGVDSVKTISGPEEVKK